ncbi:BCCT family transporter [[Clostridium] symbiosum]|uniref:BCCT family transporter n=1 Tax=Clostridium symbiosum TaxID=1512 RepID=UPI00210E6926|nr:BCCT family transporter [[Clostridium] symbiosum]
MSGEGNKKDEVRWGVFLPAFLIIGGGALLGILKNDWLTKMCSAIFGWSLKSFGWLYQLVAIFCLVVVIIITFSKIGNVRFGGKNAPVFILQLAATFKVFFIDKIIEEVEEDEITVQPEMMAELTEAQANA